MRIDASRVVGAYAAVVTLALVWALTGSAGAPPGAGKVLDVERINVREPDGTLRLAIASHARMPGIVVEGREYSHPNRPDAGMIFYNDEGTEDGGLVFNGRRTPGGPTNGGSLTFDRWRQDQTIQVVSEENGPKRSAALVVTDRDDAPMRYADLQALLAQPSGPARDAAFRAAHFVGRRRAYLGRDEAGASRLVLSDAAGRPRLVLAAPADGAPSMTLLDAAGRATRTLR